MNLSEEIQAAIQAHAMWKINLLKAIEHGESPLNPDEVQRDDHCSFGKWLFGGTIPDEAQAMEEFKTCVRLHKEFHEQTGIILRLALHGERREALAAMTEPSPYHELSATLIQHLKLWRARWELSRKGLPDTSV